MSTLRKAEGAFHHFAHGGGIVHDEEPDFVHEISPPFPDRAKVASSFSVQLSLQALYKASSLIGGQALGLYIRLGRSFAVRRVFVRCLA
jgi:hypothetical protein